MDMVLQNTKRDGTIPQVLQRLREEQESKVDAVLTETRHVQPVTWLEELEGEQEGRTRNRVGLAFDTPEVPQLNRLVLPVSDVGHGQLASRAGVPKRYYDRMVQEAPELWERTLATWWEQEPRQRLVRAFQPNGSPGMVRAWLSDRYRCLDHLPFLEAVLTATEERTAGRFLVSQATVTDERCYVRLLTERQEATQVGEVVQQGISIANSEVGAGKVKVQPFAVVLSCRNGMVSTRDYGQVHLGGELDPGLLSQESVQARARAVWSEVRDFVSAALDPDHLLSFVRRVDQAAEEELHVPARQAVGNVVRHFGMGGQDGQRVLDRYLRGASQAGETQWGLVQALTYEAHQSASWERQVELEEAGGQLLELEGMQLRRLLARKLSDRELENTFSN
jgi:hypothetical protein